MADVCKRHELCSSPVGVPEVKVEWEGRPIKHPVTYTRTSNATVYAEFCGPEEIINDSWGDIRECAIGAAVTAGIAAYVATPDVALPAFKAAFAKCLGEKAEKIQIKLGAEQTAGPWHKV